VDGVGKWELKWRRNFFLWAEQILRELEEVVGSVVIAEAQDKWIWKQNGEEDFFCEISLCCSRFFVASWKNSISN
jgi:hypothetical protein